MSIHGMDTSSLAEPVNEAVELSEEHKAVINSKRAEALEAIKARYAANS